MSMMKAGTLASLRSWQTSRTQCRVVITPFQELGAKRFFANDGDNHDGDRRVNIKSTAHGLPDFVEHWNLSLFRKVGYGLAATTALSVASTEPILVATLASTTAAYWYMGLRDIQQTSQTIRRNFPVLGRMRYILESIRPEIRQYFVEGDNEPVPFSRLQRSIAYQRAKGVNSSMPFGTRYDTTAVGYEWVNHSLYPTKLKEQRVVIGQNNPDVTQPYSSSLLNISAMSYGALSDRAVLALSSGARLGGFSHNTGEGGISQYHKDGGADLVWNLGTAYFGAGAFDENGNRIFDPNLFERNAHYCKMVEIKLSQGAKPAHGGLLPKEKISEEIAKARDLPFPATQDCDSPPRHSAFSNPHELCDFIVTLRRLSGGKPVGIKLCVGHPREFVALVQAFVETGIHPDFITVDGAEGGTGAAPPEFSNRIGTPLGEGLSFVHSVLVGAGLRDPIDKAQSSVSLIASGKVLTGYSMFKSFALGADVCNAARSFLFSLGCIQALKCNANTCPTGITTSNPDLTWGLDPSSKQIRVASFHRETVKSCMEVMESTGVNSWAEVGPHLVVKRIGVGQSRTLAEIYGHLQVERGELLKGTGPSKLIEEWNA